MLARLRITVSLALTVLLLAGCSLFGTSLHWSGSWTAQDGSSSGALTMELFIANSDAVSGSMTLTGHPLGTFDVSGTRVDEYGGTDHYEELDLHDAGSTAIISLLKGGYGLNDESVVAGTLTYNLGTYFININQ